MHLRVYIILFETVLVNSISLYSPEDIMPLFQVYQYIYMCIPYCVYALLITALDSLSSMGDFGILKLFNVSCGPL